MLVDYERVLLELKRHVADKSHHGQRELFALIAQLEVAHQIDESLPERALRQYGLEFFEEAVRTPGSPRDRVPVLDGEQAHALRGDSQPESEEDDHGPRGPAGNGSASGVATIVGRRRTLHP